MDVAAYLLVYAIILIFLSFYVKSGTLFLLVGGVHAFYFILSYLVLGEEFSKDLANYYMWATTGQRIGYLGTELTVTIVRFFAVYLNMNYLSVAALFSISAVSGLYMVMKSILRAESNLVVRLLSAGVILSPSINVFTSLIAKELIVLFFFGLLIANLRRDRPMVSLCLAMLIGAVRPYFGAALAGAIVAPTLVRYVARGRGGVAVLLAGYIALVGVISWNVGVNISYLNKYGIDTSEGVLTAVESRREVYSRTEFWIRPTVLWGCSKSGGVYAWHRGWRENKYVQDIRVCGRPYVSLGLNRGGLAIGRQERSRYDGDVDLSHVATSRVAAVVSDRKFWVGCASAHDARADGADGVGLEPEGWRRSESAAAKTCLTSNGMRFALPSRRNGFAPSVTNFRCATASATQS